MRMWLSVWSFLSSGRNWTFPSLEGLFADSTNVRNLFDLFDIAPDVVDAFMSLTIKPEKVGRSRAQGFRKVGFWRKSFIGGFTVARVDLSDISKSLEKRFLH